MSDKEEREGYTWEIATKDLALMTPITFREACQWINWAKDLDTNHPYDVLPVLIKIVNSLPDPHVSSVFFENMNRLFNEDW